MIDLQLTEARTRPRGSRRGFAWSRPRGADRIFFLRYFAERELSARSPRFAASAKARSPLRSPSRARLSWRALSKTHAGVGGGLMPPNHGGADEHRRNLDELEPVLRDRILRLDEPVARSDWGAVRPALAGTPFREPTFAGSYPRRCIRPRAGGHLGTQRHANRRTTGEIHDSSTPACTPPLTDGSGFVVYSRPSVLRLSTTPTAGLVDDPRPTRR